MKSLFIFLGLITTGCASQKISNFNFENRFPASSYSGESNSSEEEFAVSGVSYISAGFNAYPGDSRDSRRVWNHTCSDAQKVAYDQAKYDCQKRGLKIKAYKFDADGGYPEDKKCYYNFFSVGFTAHLKFTCGSNPL